MGTAEPPPRADRASRSRRLLPEAAALVAFAGLAGVETGLWRRLGTHVFVGPDPLQDTWIVSWVSGHLLGPRLFDGNIFFPSRDSVLFCNPLLGPSALVLPARLFTANPVLLYNLAVLLSLVASSYGFYRLGVWLFASRAAGLVAAIAVPYTAHAAAHVVHLDQLTTAGFPWVLLCLLRLLEGAGPGWAVGLGAAFALQAATNGYHAWSTLFLCLVVAVWGRRRLTRPRVLVRVAGAAAIAALLLAPYVLGFARLRAEADLRRELNTAYTVDLATGWMASTSWLAQRAFGSWAANSTPVFPGFTVVALAAIGLWRGRHRTTSLWVAVFAVFYLLALGPELRVFGRAIAPLPYAALFHHLPFFSSMRHPGSFVLPAMIGVGMLAASGAAAAGLGRRPAVFALVLAAMLAETARDLPRRAERPRALPEVYRRLAGEPPGALFEWPSQDHETQWWSIFHGRPIVNGACGSFGPRRYYELWQRVQQEWRRPQPDGLERSVSLAYLKAHFPVRYVLVHGDAPAQVHANLAGASDSFEPLFSTSAGDRVFRLHRGGRGPRLRRAFRDDQLRAGALHVTLDGPPDGALAVSLNGAPLAEVLPASGRRALTWPVPPERIQRGLNWIVIAQTGAGPPFRLRDIDIVAASPPGSGPE